MPQIFRSIFTIIAVLALVAGGTAAYFSDVEISRDNQFAAGAIDLKVDSEAHYNGLVCRDGFWVEPEPVICEDIAIVVKEAGEDADPEKFSNGIGSPDQECQAHGFAYGIAKWGWDEEEAVFTAEDDPDGTFVFGSSQEAYWSASNSIAGIIRKAGQDSDVFLGGLAGVITAGGHDISHLTFCGGQENFCGNCIRDEDEECDGNDGLPNGYFCSADCRLVETGECPGNWEETDLVPGVHKYFEFDDIKPGDNGEDTVSLHIYGNDAWARLVFDNIVDIDNGCVEPEVEADSDCDEVSGPGGEGELRENLDFWVWLDQGSVPGFQNTGKAPLDDGYDPEEGDNIWQEANEPLLREAGAVEAVGESLDIWPDLSLLYSNDCFGFPADGNNNHGICQGLAGDGRLVASTTYYFAIGWELPGETSNAAQSDIFGADISWQVEQWRNNPSPF